MNLTAPTIFQSLARFLALPHRAHQADIRRVAAVQVVLLPMNGTFDVERSCGCRIECVRGSIWITHIGEGRDVVVEAGSSFSGDREGPMFIQALVPAEFKVAVLHPLAKRHAGGRL
jgi:hypothetical protein